MWRNTRGYSRSEVVAKDEDFERLAIAFVERSQADRERLDEMMRYAQVIGCRRHIPHEYFGELAGEPCGTCDNCL